MKFFLVGGAVRDQLLGITAHERDWVVVGGNESLMRQLHFKQVGKDFPVFLHPQTREEYALARTERKTAPGYKGFAVNASPDITLEEDLERRDLTINAIAQDENGNIVDPFNGRSDIENKKLRHVSAAFSEDPVRILRVARFAARFNHLGFSVADETMQLMRAMVDNGEINALVAERVWKDTEKALATDNPEVYFEILRECGALEVLFPEISALFGVPQPEEHHPEIDTGIHTLMVVKQAALLTKDLPTRFAALVHDLGKATTPKEEWPKHVAHEERGVPLIKALCKRLRIPNDYRDLAIHVSRYHLHVHRAAELKPNTILKVIKAIDALRRPQRFESFLIACEADARGRKGLESRDYSQPDIFRSALHAATAVNIKTLIDEGFEGAQLQQQITQRQIHAISSILK